MSIVIGMNEMTNEQYHSSPGVSKSGLDLISAEIGQAPIHYWEKYINPDREPEEKTPALVFGNCLHSAILEPDLFEARHVCGLDLDRRSAANKQAHREFLAENYNKTIMSSADYEQCLRMRDKVHAHPKARGLLVGGKAEQTYFAKEPRSGALIKTRMDYYRESFAIVDLKSCESASRAAFSKAAANYRYDIQAFWYPFVLRCCGIEPPDEFIWLAVEKSSPYAIGIYYAQPDLVENAGRAAMRDLAKIIHCMSTNEWPDYAGESIEPLILPSWAKR